MTLQWSLRARRELDALYRYYHKLSPKVAIYMHNEVIDEAERLIDWPDLGQIDPDLTGFRYVVRSLVILNGLYRLVYFTDKETVVIHSLWACRQNPKKKFDHKRNK